MTLSDKSTLTQFQKLRDRLRSHIDQGLSEYDDPVKDWRRAAEGVVKEHFGSGSQQAKDLKRCFNRGGILGRGDGAAYERSKRENLVRAAKIIDGLVQEIEDFWQPTVSDNLNRISTSDCYVEPSRIDGLSSINAPAFDQSRLIALCHELNVAWQHGCHHSVAMLVRAILDHVPPVFGGTNKIFSL